MFLGPGRNGKGTLLRVLGALLGHDNVSNVTLQQLAESRFAAADLFGKLANIAGDLDARAIKQTDVFKMVTGGDAVSAERKYGRAFSFRPYATLLFAANEAPLSYDQTDAWFDRWLVLPFDRRFVGTDQDPHLDAKLQTPAELAGFLVRAVTGLRRLLERGRFDEPPSIRHASTDYRTRLDSLRGFLEEAELVLHPDAWVPRKALYSEYRTWAFESGRQPVSAQVFNERLRRDADLAISERKRKGTVGWIGIGLAAETDLETPEPEPEPNPYHQQSF